MKREWRFVRIVVEERALDSMQQNVSSRSPTAAELLRPKSLPVSSQIQHGCVLGSRIRAEESVLPYHHKVLRQSSTFCTPLNRRLGYMQYLKTCVEPGKQVKEEGLVCPLIYQEKRLLYMRWVAKRLMAMPSAKPTTIYHCS